MPGTVAVVGSGPAADALVAALSDAAADDDGPAVSVRRADALSLDDSAAAVVVDRVGADAFGAASEAAVAAETPWIAVELGGIGGYPVTDAAITAFDPRRTCFECLRGRVAANVEADADPVGVPGPTTQHVAGALAADLAVDVVRARAAGAGAGTGGGPDARSTRPGESPFGRILEVPHRERRLLPLPGCGCAGERDRTVTRNADGLDVEAALRRGELALDDRVGIVAELGEAESHPAPYYLAGLCDTSGFSDATAPRQAAGVAADWDRAFLKGLGESFERYAAAVYRSSALARARAVDLAGDGAVVPPTDFATPGEPDWAASEETAWVRATDLAADAPAWVPASFVLYPSPGPDFRPATTTGLGLHTSSTDAVLSGLYEVIERDAAVLAWYSTYEPLGLAVEDEPFRSLAARAGSEDLTVTPLLCTQDVDVPVVAVAVHRSEWPRLALGTAANLDPAVAARGALEEAVQNWMELRRMGPEAAREASGAIGDHAELLESGRDLIDVDETVPAASVGPSDPPTGEAELDAVLDRLDDAGLSAYASRTTTRDLESIGFEAVRALVPDAQPLFFGEAYFSERATTVPEALGFEPRLDREHHPFP